MLYAQYPGGYVPLEVGGGHLPGAVFSPGAPGPMLPMPSPATFQAAADERVEKSLAILLPDAPVVKSAPTAPLAPVAPAPPTRQAVVDPTASVVKAPPVLAPAPAPTPQPSPTAVVWTPEGTAVPVTPAWNPLEPVSEGLSTMKWLAIGTLVVGGIIGVALLVR